MKKKYILAIIVIMLCVLASIASAMSVNSGIVRKEGLYNFTLDEDTPEYDADAVVPDKETLINKLQEADYEIDEYTTPLDSHTIAERVVAKKGKEFIDICYGLTEKEADNIFAEYENEYLSTDFCVLARNENYVYCASSENVLKQSGFETFSNNGVLYINK